MQNDSDDGVNILFRTDAGVRIGSGHVMRCIAFAQGVRQESGNAVFVMHAHGKYIGARLKSERIRCHYIETEPGTPADAKQTCKLARENDCRWVVVDGYHFGAVYQQIIKDAGLKLLFVDDNGHAESYCCDIILNQHINAHEDLYRRKSPGTRLLLGTDYALLRKEFIDFRDFQRKNTPIARKILITLGGSDPDNITLKAIRAARQVNIDGLQAIVVIGGGNPNFKKLKSSVATAPFDIKLLHDVTNMPDLMAWADVALSSVGLTSLELAFMQLPYLMLTLADSQLAAAKILGEMGISVDLGWGNQIEFPDIGKALEQLMLDYDQRDSMSRNGKKLLDGLGAKRILAVMRKTT